MSDTKIVIDKDIIAKIDAMIEESELKKNENRSKGLYSLCSASDSFVSGLLSVKQLLIDNATEIQIDKSIEQRAMDENLCKCDSCLEFAKNGLYVKGATQQQIIEQLKAKNKHLTEFDIWFIKKAIDLKEAILPLEEGCLSEIEFTKTYGISKLSAEKGIKKLYDKII